MNYAGTDVRACETYAQAEEVIVRMSWTIAQTREYLARSRVLVAHINRILNATPAVNVR